MNARVVELEPFGAPEALTTDGLTPRDEPYPAGLNIRVKGSSGINAPPTVLEWFWKWPDELPQKGRTDANGLKAYERRLAGEPVEDAFDHLNLIL